MSTLTAARAIDPVDSAAFELGVRNGPPLSDRLDERCVNPICTPGQLCPEFRCDPTIRIFPTTTATCINPVCKPGEPCPEYRCATFTHIMPTPTVGCVNPVCTPGEECPEFRCAGQCNHSIIPTCKNCILIRGLSARFLTLVLNWK